MSDNPVILKIENGIAYVTLNRPDKHNALNIQMFKAIDRVIKQLKKTAGIRVVIVSGCGDSFCSGLDIKSVLANPKHGLKLLWKWLPGNANLAQRVSVGWRRLNIPVIMVLHGKCWGGGMQIALGGDYRIAAPDCSLSIMESRWGLIPDMGGTPALFECVAGDQAMKLAMSSDIIDAKQAAKLGLLTELAEDPKEAALDLANKLIERSPDSNQQIKKMYHQIWSGNERKILAKETLNQIKVLFGKNQRIAVKRAQGKSDLQYRA